MKSDLSLSESSRSTLAYISRAKASPKEVRPFTATPDPRRPNIDVPKIHKHPVVDQRRQAHAVRLPGFLGR